MDEARHGGTRYRVEELARVSGTSVNTIRYYQHRGLLQPPAREGRLAFYSAAHLARLERIRELKEQGLPLATIERVLSGIHPADAALVSAVMRADEAKLTLEEVAQVTRVPTGLVESLVEEGLLVPRSPGSERRFTESDVRAVRAGMTLLEAGVPLSRLLELGRSYSRAVEEAANEAVALFDEYVRRPARSEEQPPVASKRVLEAFERLLPAASALVRHSFERALLSAAERRIAEAGN